MVSRRQSLQLAGAAVATALAGCSGVLDDGSDRAEHELYVDRIATEPVQWALDEPDDDDELFGGPARAALDEIIPDGRYTARGYVPIWEGEYVERDGRYYRTEQFVTGRATVERPVVRVESVDDDAVPDDAVLVDSLDRPSARVVKILHSHAASGGAAGSPELMRGDAYVLARPAERDSPLATDLDGRVVTMTDTGGWPYRIQVSHERVSLTEHTVIAVELADSREAFREVVLGAEVDVDLSTVDLPSDAGDLLDDAIGREVYRETGEPSAAFETLLQWLEFEVGESENGVILWYGESLFRAGYYAPQDD